MKKVENIKTKPKNLFKKISQNYTYRHNCIYTAHKN